MERRLESLQPLLRDLFDSLGVEGPRRPFLRDALSPYQHAEVHPAAVFRELAGVAEKQRYHGFEERAVALEETAAWLLEDTLAARNEGGQEACAATIKLLLNLSRSEHPAIPTSKDRVMEALRRGGAPPHGNAVVSYVADDEDASRGVHTVTTNRSVVGSSTVSINVGHALAGERGSASSPSNLRGTDSESAPPTHIVVSPGSVGILPVANSGGASVPSLPASPPRQKDMKGPSFKMDSSGLRLLSSVSAAAIESSSVSESASASASAVALLSSSGGASSSTIPAVMGSTDEVNDLRTSVSGNGNGESAGDTLDAISGNGETAGNTLDAWLADIRRERGDSLESHHDIFGGPLVSVVDEEEDDAAVEEKAKMAGDDGEDSNEEIEAGARYRSGKESGKAAMLKSKTASGIDAASVALLPSSSCLNAAGNGTESSGIPSLNSSSVPSSTPIKPSPLPPLRASSAWHLHESGEVVFYRGFSDGHLLPPDGAPHIPTSTAPPPPSDDAPTQAATRKALLHSLCAASVRALCGYPSFAFQPVARGAATSLEREFARSRRATESLHSLFDDSFQERHGLARHWIQDWLGETLAGTVDARLSAVRSKDASRLGGGSVGADAQQSFSSGGSGSASSRFAAALARLQGNDNKDAHRTAEEEGAGGVMRPSPFVATMQSPSNCLLHPPPAPPAYFHLAPSTSWHQGVDVAPQSTMGAAVRASSARHLYALLERVCSILNMAADIEMVCQSVLDSSAATLGELLSTMVLEKLGKSSTIAAVASPLLEATFASLRAALSMPLWGPTCQTLAAYLLKLVSDCRMVLCQAFPTLGGREEGGLRVSSSSSSSLFTILAYLEQEGGVASALRWAHHLTKTVFLRGAKAASHAVVPPSSPSVAASDGSYFMERGGLSSVPGRGSLSSSSASSFSSSSSATTAATFSATAQTALPWLSTLAKTTLEDMGAFPFIVDCFASTSMDEKEKSSASAPTLSSERAAPSSRSHAAPLSSTVRAGDNKMGDLILVMANGLVGLSLTAISSAQRALDTLAVSWEDSQGSSAGEGSGKGASSRKDDGTGSRDSLKCAPLQQSFVQNNWGGGVGGSNPSILRLDDGGISMSSTPSAIPTFPLTRLSAECLSLCLGALLQQCGGGHASATASASASAGESGEASERLLQSLQVTLQDPQRGHSAHTFDKGESKREGSDDAATPDDAERVGRSGWQSKSYRMKQYPDVPLVSTSQVRATVVASVALTLTAVLQDLDSMGAGGVKTEQEMADRMGAGGVKREQEMACPPTQLPPPQFAARRREGAATIAIASPLSCEVLLSGDEEEEEATARYDDAAASGSNSAVCTTAGSTASTTRSLLRGDVPASTASSASLAAAVRESIAEVHDCVFFYLSAPPAPPTLPSLILSSIPPSSSYTSSAWAQVTGELVSRALSSLHTAVLPVFFQHCAAATSFVATATGSVAFPVIGNSLGFLLATTRTFSTFLHYLEKVSTIEGGGEGAAGNDEKSASRGGAFAHHHALTSANAWRKMRASFTAGIRGVVHSKGGDDKVSHLPLAPWAALYAEAEMKVHGGGGGKEGQRELMPGERRSRLRGRDSSPSFPLPLTGLTGLVAKIAAGDRASMVGSTATSNSDPAFAAAVDDGGSADVSSTRAVSASIALPSQLPESDTAAGGQHPRKSDRVRAADAPSLLPALSLASKTVIGRGLHPLPGVKRSLWWDIDAQVEVAKKEAQAAEGAVKGLLSNGGLGEEGNNNTLTTLSSASVSRSLTNYGKRRPRRHRKHHRSRHPSRSRPLPSSATLGMIEEAEENDDEDLGEEEEDGEEGGEIEEEEEEDEEDDKAEGTSGGVGEGGENAEARSRRDAPTIHDSSTTPELVAATESLESIVFSTTAQAAFTNISTAPLLTVTNRPAAGSAIPPTHRGGIAIAVERGKAAGALHKIQYNPAPSSSSSAAAPGPPSTRLRPADESSGPPLASAFLDWFQDASPFSAEQVRLLTLEFEALGRGPREHSIRVVPTAASVHKVRADGAEEAVYSSETPANVRHAVDHTGPSVGRYAAGNTGPGVARHAVDHTSPWVGRHPLRLLPIHAEALLLPTPSRLLTALPHSRASAQHSSSTDSSTGSSTCRSIQSALSRHLMRENAVAARSCCDLLLYDCALLDHCWALRAVCMMEQGHLMRPWAREIYASLDWERRAGRGVGSRAEDAVASSCSGRGFSPLHLRPPSLKHWRDGGALTHLLQTLLGTAGPHLQRRDSRGGGGGPAATGNSRLRPHHPVGEMMGSSQGGSFHGVGLSPRGADLGSVGASPRKATSGGTIPSPPGADFFPSSLRNAPHFSLNPSAFRVVLDGGAVAAAQQHGLSPTAATAAASSSSIGAQKSPITGGSAGGSASFSSLRLVYEIPGPVSLVIPASRLGDYTRIFQHLLSLGWAAWQLEGLNRALCRLQFHLEDKWRKWLGVGGGVQQQQRSNPSATRRVGGGGGGGGGAGAGAGGGTTLPLEAGRHSSSSPSPPAALRTALRGAQHLLHAISLGRHRLAHVISSISNSTLHLLLVRPWLEFQRALQYATYPGQIAQAHSAYLAACLRLCFLDPSQKSLSASLLSLLHYTEAFVKAATLSLEDLELATEAALRAERISREADEILALGEYHADAEDASLAASTSLEADTRRPTEMRGGASSSRRLSSTPSASASTRRQAIPPKNLAFILDAFEAQLRPEVLQRHLRQVLQSKQSFSTAVTMLCSIGKAVARNAAAAGPSLEAQTLSEVVMILNFNGYFE